MLILLVAALENNKAHLECPYVNSRAVAPHYTEALEVLLNIERISSSSLIENSMPDGSKVIIDQAGERVYALNSTAGAAWDACSTPTTLSRITETMKSSFGPAVTEELAEQAVLQLQEQNLVAASEPVSPNGRRQFLMGLGLVALPIVVSMTMGAQKAHAAVAQSGPIAS